MPYVIHHNDHDGKCSAAITLNELLPIFVKEQVVCIEYNYGYKVDWDELINPDHFLPTGKEICYIVDIALNDEIFDVIKKLVENNVKVIHIDHHQATLDYINSNIDKGSIMSQITKFYNTKYSATMLCWVYSCMNESEREKPMDIKFDFTPNFSHVMINVDNEAKAREYKIYPGIFYIDDYDIWRHSNSNTIAFHYGLSTLQDMNPKLDELWGDIIYGNERILSKYLDKGSAIAEHKKQEYDRILKRGHAITINTESDVIPDGIAYGFIVNNVCDSFMFESIKKDYDVCIAYWYDGRIKKWRYSFRSSDESKFDCNKYAKLFGGGGHTKSSGCVVDKPIIEF